MNAQHQKRYLTAIAHASLDRFLREHGMHWHGFETDTDAGLYLLTFFGNGHRLTLGYCAHKRLMRVSLHSETYDDPFVLYAVGDGYAAPESNTAGIRMLAHPMGRAFSHVARHMIEADA